MFSIIAKDVQNTMNAFREGYDASFSMVDSDSPVPAHPVYLRIDEFATIHNRDLSVAYSHNDIYQGYISTSVEEMKDLIYNWVADNYQCDSIWFNMIMTDTGELILNANLSD